MPADKTEDVVQKELKVEKKKRQRLESKVRELQKKVRVLEKDKSNLNQRVDKLMKENLMLKEKIEGPIGSANTIHNDQDMTTILKENEELKNRLMDLSEQLFLQDLSDNMESCILDKSVSIMKSVSNYHPRMRNTYSPINDRRSKISV